MALLMSAVMNLSGELVGVVVDGFGRLLAMIHSCRVALYISVNT